MEKTNFFHESYLKKPKLHKYVLKDTSGYVIKMTAALLPDISIHIFFVRDKITKV